MLVISPRVLGSRPINLSALSPKHRKPADQSRTVVDDVDAQRLLPMSLVVVASE